MPHPNRPQNDPGEAAVPPCDGGSGPLSSCGPSGPHLAGWTGLISTQRRENEQAEQGTEGRHRPGSPGRPGPAGWPVGDPWVPPWGLENTKSCC